MALKATFMSLSVLLLVQCLMFCLPVVSAGRDLASVGETSSISDSKLGKTTLAVATIPPPVLDLPKIDTSDPLKSLEDSIISLQKTVKSIFLPVWAIRIPLEVESFENNLIDAKNNVTLEALELSIKSLQQTLEFIFFPFLGIPKNLKFVDKSVESLAEFELRTLENSIRSLESWFKFVFFPFLDIPETVDGTEELVQQLAFKSLEKYIQELHSAFKFIFYPYLPSPLRTLEKAFYSGTGAKLRTVEFSIRSTEEILKILFLPVRIIPQSLEKSAKSTQDLTFKSLERSIQSLTNAFEFVFHPFLNVPFFLKPVDFVITKEEEIILKTVDTSIKTVQQSLKYIFFPYLVLPNAAEALEKVLNETGLPEPVHVVANYIQTLDDILLHVFFPVLPLSPPPPPGKHSLNLISYLVNVLKALDDTLTRLLLPSASSTPSSLLEYLWNDLVSLDNTLQYVLFPFTTDPIPHRARVSRMVGVTN
ncbi:hypothetical protein Mapa_011279 [Marchantia paleacea]|nr:hypothetical protein Mapa_011279 [Marchantia paleacea]